MSAYSVTQLSGAMTALQILETQGAQAAAAAPQTVQAGGAQVAAAGAQQAAPAKVSLVATLLAGLQASAVQTKAAEKELLNTTVLVYKATRAALDSLEGMQLSAFDALVSDCACQMRALFIANIARRYLDVEAFREELKAIKVIINAKIASLQAQAGAISKNKEAAPVADGSLAKVIAQGNGEMEVPWQVVELARAYLLTRTKAEDQGKKGVGGDMCTDCNTPVKGLKQRTEYYALNKMHKCSEASMRAIVDSAKVGLATFSCSYIREQAAGLTLDPFIRRLLTNEVTVLDRRELPAYATVMALFESCRQQKEPIPVLLRIRKALHTVELKDPYDVELLLRPNKAGEFALAMPAKEDFTRPVIVLEGQRCGKAIQQETVEGYIKRLSAASFMDIVAMNAAAHRQYTDPAKPVVALEEMTKAEPQLLAGFAKLKERAQKEGCCLESQTLLRLTHIFCDTLGNSMKGNQK